MSIHVAQTEPDDPVIMIGGRPLLLVSVQGSSRMPDCVPVEIAWRRPPSGEPETYLIKPTDQWTDTSWDDGFLYRVGLTQEVAVRKGTPAALVARRCRKVFENATPAVAHDSYERLLLERLLVFEELDVHPMVVDLSAMLVALGEALGFSRFRTARIIAADTDPLATPVRPDATVWAQGGMVRALLDQALREGRWKPGKPLHLPDLAAEL
jgi:hypothetical protein